MKHVRNITQLPASADDFEPGPIPISVKVAFIIQLLTALVPILSAKYPTTT
jgi:hypothetical protein